jgi:uncharacterized protein YndB with AHSA1/START domain
MKITVETKIKAPLKTIWELWTGVEHIEKWNNASADWHTPTAVNNLKIAGGFSYRMEARDGSFGFDFSGTYTNIELYKKIEYKLDDGRMVRIDFIEEGDEVAIVETFETEKVNPPEMQKTGWQAILDNFKAYTLAYNGKTASLLRSARGLFKRLA